MMDRKARIAVFGVFFVVGILLLGLALAKPAAKACSDKLDNDGDGLIDLADPGCANKNDLSELNPFVECDDGIDNDGDGKSDFHDAGCLSPVDNDESNCGDGACEGLEACNSCVADCGTCNTCSDTDGGFVTGTFGIISGYYNNNYYSNADQCSDAKTLTEYYCVSATYGYSANIGCGNDTYGSAYCSGNTVYSDFADYFCSSGACGLSVTPVLLEDCDESDFYGQNYCLNNSVVREYNNYYCSGGACLLVKTPEFVKTCVSPSVCTSGQCVIPDSCSDTDYGYDPFAKGTVSGYQDSVIYALTDYCVDGNAVKEYYCAGSHAYSENIPCAMNMTGTCYDGACT